MPIRPEFRPYYRRHWHALSKHLREVRAGNVCECAGVCGGHYGPCGAEHGKPNPRTGGKTTLTAAHLDQDPRDHNPDRLLVMCQSCHLRYDRQPGQIARRERIAREILGQTSLFDEEEKQKPTWRHWKQWRIDWMRAVHESYVHAAADRPRPYFTAISHRRPMTITAFSQITSHLRGWSRTKIRTSVEARGIEPVGVDDRNCKLYDPRDVVSAVVGEDSARWIFGESP